MTKTNLAYFKAAKAISELSDHNQYKIGAVVVMNHRIISSGHNSDTKTHPLQKKYNKYRFTDEGEHKKTTEYWETNTEKAMPIELNIQAPESLSKKYISTGKDFKETLTLNISTTKLEKNLHKGLNTVLVCPSHEFTRMVTLIKFVRLS